MRYSWKYFCFCCFGSFGVAVDSSLLYVLAFKFDWPLALAKLCAVEVVILTNFIMNQSLTFFKIVNIAHVV